MITHTSPYLSSPEKFNRNNILFTRDVFPSTAAMDLITSSLIRSLLCKGKVTLKYLQCDYLYTIPIILRNISVRTNSKKIHARSFKMEIFNTHCPTEFNTKHESFGNWIKTINRKQLSSILIKIIPLILSYSLRNKKTANKKTTIL